MGADRGRNIDDLEPPVGEQRLRVVVDPVDAKLVSAPDGLVAVDVADRNHRHAGIPPCPQMVEADHAGANKRDARRAIAICSDLAQAARSVSRPPR